MKTAGEVKGVLEPIFNNDGSIRCVFIHIKNAHRTWEDEDENTQQIDIEHDSWVFAISSSPNYFGGHDNIYLKSAR